MKTAALLGLTLLGLWGGCRRKHVAPSLESGIPAAPAEATATASGSESLAVAPPLPPAFGHPPTTDELRARLVPLFPQIARCIIAAGAVEASEKYLQLRFGISPGTGRLLSAEIEGHEAARGCINEVLRAITVAPWSGDVTILTIPLTHSGEPVPESAFGDAGGR